jgi:hypothetical protein
MERVQQNLQMYLERAVGRELSYIDLAFLDEVEKLMIKLKLEPNAQLVKNFLEEFKGTNFPVYLLFIKLNEKLFSEVLKNTNWPYDIALMQLFIFDPLTFSEKYEVIKHKKIRDFCLELLFTPKDVFWNWSEKYDLIVREVFEVVSFHPEGIAIEEINGKLGQLASQHKIQEVLSNSSILLKYFFVIEQNGRYYPFFSNCITQDALTKAREQLRTMASQRAELLRIEYYMPKYHVDVILKLLKGAKNLTTILRTWANKEIRFDDVKITRTLLKTRKTGLSKYMISRMKERFEALENDGLLQLVQGKYFITDLAKELISNNNIVLSLGYSDILLFEEKIVKKGHEYWDIKEYLDYMLRLGLLKEVAQHPDRLFYITSKGKDVLRRGFDPRILFER